MQNARLDAHPAGSLLDITLGSSVVAAIDELIARYAGRRILTVGEVVDALLDLRLIAVADEPVRTLV
jgi:hypothetical protein